jgi:hypothetical protein
MMKSLNETAGQNPFKVPENYFEDVSRKIISITAETSTESRKPGIFTRLRPYLAVAASVAVLVLLSYLAVRMFFPSNRNEVIPEISMEEFTDTYLNDIDIITLEENADPLSFSEEIPEVSSSDLIDYLVFENVGINEIYELL